VAIRVNFPWSIPSIAREPGETDDQLRKRVENHKHRRNLRNLLERLGVKSANGVDTAFKWHGGTRVPGVYSNVKVTADANL
jgi:hypothetical protein